MTNRFTSYLVAILPALLLFFPSVSAFAQSTVIGVDTPNLHASTVIAPAGKNQAESDEFPRSSMNNRQKSWEYLLAQVYPTQFEGLNRCDQIIRKLQSIGLPVTLDLSAQDDSLTFDEPLQLGIPSEPLYVRLQTALEEKNAVLVIVGHRLLIASMDVIYDPQYFLTVTYDVSELDMDQYSLVDQIKANVAPDDWYDTNGDAVIETFVISGRRAITLSAQYPIHREIREYLRGLKSLQGNIVANKSALRISPLTASRVIELPGKPVRQRPGGKGGGGGIGGYGLGGGVF